MYVGAVPFMVATGSWPQETVQARSSNGPVEVEVNRTSSGAGPVVVFMVNAAVILGTTGSPSVVKSRMTSPKSMRPLPL